MNLGDLKFVYLLLCLTIGAIILLPNFFTVLSLSNEEPFSELYILGPSHALENIPSNVMAKSLNTIYLGVNNQMGEVASYLIYVKIRNQTEPLPDIIRNSPSSLTPILEYRMILSDNEGWEKEVSFSFDNVLLNGNETIVSGMSIDGHFVSIDKTSAWNAEEKKFFYQLFFELWIFESVSSDFRFHNRFVGLNLNLTREP